MSETAVEEFCHLANRALICLYKLIMLVWDAVSRPLTMKSPIFLKSVVGAYWRLTVVEQSSKPAH